MGTLRTVIGLVITKIIGLGIYFGYVNILYAAVNLAVVYDATYMWKKLSVNKLIVITFFVTLIIFNYYLKQCYHDNPGHIIQIIVVSQTSDIYQYVAGKCFGRNKIGWISPNKTLEGYAIGYFLTIFTLLPIYDGSNITSIYVLGVLGGLISSLFKRIVGIKDYSNLLGPHGGWTDRIDSIIGPVLFS